MRGLSAWFPIVQCDDNVTNDDDLHINILSLQAYDNVESSVRKASVFCIVAIHKLVGESSIQPHLECLNGSKMKLLSLYIKRAQAQSNAGV